MIIAHLNEIRNDLVEYGAYDRAYRGLKGVNCRTLFNGIPTEF